MDAIVAHANNKYTHITTLKRRSCKCSLVPSLPSFFRRSVTPKKDGNKAAVSALVILLKILFATSDSRCFLITLTYA